MLLIMCVSVLLRGVLTGMKAFGRPKMVSLLSEEPMNNIVLDEDIKYGIPFVDNKAIIRGSMGNCIDDTMCTLATNGKFPFMAGYYILIEGVLRFDTNEISSRPTKYFRNYGCGCIKEKNRTNDIAILKQLVNPPFKNQTSETFDSNEFGIDWYVSKGETGVWHIDGQLVPLNRVKITYTKNDKPYGTVYVKNGSDYNIYTDEEIAKTSKNEDFYGWYDNDRDNIYTPENPIVKNVTSPINITYMTKEKWSEMHPTSQAFSESHDFTTSETFSSTNMFTLTITDLFTLSQAFSSTNVFTESREFSVSDDFTMSQTFCPSHLFTGSLSFSSSCRFTMSREFTVSYMFTISQTFSSTNIFTSSLPFVVTDMFTLSQAFSSSDLFELSDIFSPSTVFTLSEDFSSSRLFTPSIPFSVSVVFSESLTFTLSDLFTHSLSFSSSNRFTMSQEFSSSDDFTSSMNFSSSQLFTPSSPFPPSTHFSPSRFFTSSVPFTPSPTFSPTNSSDSESNSESSPAKLATSTIVVITLASIGVASGASIFTIYHLRKLGMCSKNPYSHNPTVFRMDMMTSHVL